MSRSFDFSPPPLHPSALGAAVIFIATHLSQPASIPARDLTGFSFFPGRLPSPTTAWYIQEQQPWTCSSLHCSSTKEKRHPVLTGEAVGKSPHAPDNQLTLGRCRAAAVTSCPTQTCPPSLCSARLAYWGSRSNEGAQGATGR